MSNDLGTFIGVVIATTIGTLIAMFQNKRSNKLAKSETSSELDSLRTANADLLKRVADLETIKEEQRKQLNGLIHAQALYDAQHESYTMLKDDYAELKQKFEDMRVELDTLKRGLDEANEASNRLLNEKAQLQHELDEVLSVRHDLEVANRELRNVLGLFAAEYKVAQETSPDKPDE